MSKVKANELENQSGTTVTITAPTTKTSADLEVAGSATLGNAADDSLTINGGTATFGGGYLNVNSGLYYFRAPLRAWPRVLGHHGYSHIVLRSIFTHSWLRYFHQYDQPFRFYRVLGFGRG